MSTTSVPDEKPYSTVSKNYNNNALDPKTTVVQMEVPENEEKQIDNDSNCKNLENGEKGKDLKRDKDMLQYYIQLSPEPPPYVIWVQMFGVQRQDIPPPEEPLEYDPVSRNDFVKKVFFIVFIMLCATAGIIALLNIFAEAFIRKYTLFILIPAVIASIALSYVMSCSACSRSFPCNYICLMAAVISMSMIGVCIVIRYRTVIVYCAVGATAVVVFICFLLACSSFDFTKYMLYIVVIAAAMGAILCIFLIMKLIFRFDMKPLHIGILCAATLVNCVVLCMELQMILGGRTVELGVNEYALAAYMLYMSIIDIFLKLLQIFGLIDSS